MEKALWDLQDTQCNQIETCLNKNIVKRAYQLTDDLASEKHGISTTLQDKSAEYIIEIQGIPSRWTDIAQGYTIMTVVVTMTL